jgi:hypothetical protein
VSELDRVRMKVDELSDLSFMVGIYRKLLLQFNLKFTRFELAQLKVSYLREYSVLSNEEYD